jgi:cation transport ATPase
LARAIVSEAHSRSIAIPDIDGFTSESGFGVTADYAGGRLIAGSAALLAKHGIAVQESDGATKRRTPRGDRDEGSDSASLTVVHIGIASDGKAEYLGAIGLADQIKPDSIAAIAELHRMNLRTVLLTGDNRLVAAEIARQVGIDDVRA